MNSMFSTVGKCTDVDVVKFKRAIYRDNPSNMGNALHKNAYYQVIIQFEYNTLTLTALGDCCSTSWFEKYEDIDFNSLEGKEIIDIIGENDYDMIEMPHSKVDDCDRNHVCKFIVKNPDDTTTEIKFLLRNSSNGYYDGYIRMKWKFKSHCNTPIPSAAQLVVVVGLPGCGKTTYVKTNYKIIKEDQDWTGAEASEASGRNGTFAGRNEVSGRESSNDDEYYFYDDYLKYQGENCEKIMQKLIEGKRVIIADPRLCNKDTFMEEIVRTFTKGLAYGKEDRQRNLLDPEKQVTIIGFTPSTYQCILNVMNREKSKNKPRLDQEYSAVKYIKSISNLEENYNKWFNELIRAYYSYYDFKEKIKVDTYEPVDDLVYEPVDDEEVSDGSYEDD